MKHSRDSTDPLLHSLVEDANEFPKSAAALARSQQTSRRILCGALTLATLLLTAALWFAPWTTSPGTRVGKAPLLSEAKHHPSPVQTLGFVHIYHSTDENIPEPLPQDATSREKELVDELQDLPLVIVKNNHGEVARVQILQR